MPVHNGAIGLDRPTYNLIVVLEVDDVYLWLGVWVIVRFLSHADVVIRFESLTKVRRVAYDDVIEDTYGRVESNRCLLRKKLDGYLLRGW